MVHCKWDKIHRRVRDTRLALTHSESGIFFEDAIVHKLFVGSEIQTIRDGRVRLPEKVYSERTHGHGVATQLCLPEVRREDIQYIRLFVGTN